MLYLYWWHVWQVVCFCVSCKVMAGGEWSMLESEWLMADMISEWLNAELAVRWTGPCLDLATPSWLDVIAHTLIPIGWVIILFPINVQLRLCSGGDDSSLQQRLRSSCPPPFAGLFVCLSLLSWVEPSFDCVSLQLATLCSLIVSSFSLSVCFPFRKGQTKGLPLFVILLLVFICLNLSPCQPVGVLGYLFSLHLIVIC